MTATAFSAVSLRPALCLVCIDKRARAYRPLLVHGRFGVNILSEDQEWVSARFASSRVDRFAEVSWSPGHVTSCPLIEGALCWMECEVVEVHSCGDHDIFIGQLRSVRVHDGAPLVYFRGGYSTLPPPSLVSGASEAE